MISSHFEYDVSNIININNYVNIILTFIEKYL